jgi:hypothetical protein
MGLRYIESRCEMDETQDAAPSSTEPVIETKQYSDGSSATGVAPLPDLSAAQQDAAVGDSGNAPAAAEASVTAPAIAEEAGAAAMGESNAAAADSNASATISSPESAPVASSAEGSLSSPVDSGNVDAGTASAGAATPATAVPSASLPSAEVAPLGEVSGNPSSQPSADSVVSTSAGDAGEPRAEEPKDLGTLSPSNSIADPAAGADAGNVTGQADSAATATSPEAALAGIVDTTAAAFSVDLLQKFETRQYADGTTIRTVGGLPEQSPVSYPTPGEPAADTPHGLLNSIEAYFTTAMRSSRTDGHKLIALLRAQLPQ